MKRTTGSPLLLCRRQVLRPGLERIGLSGCFAGCVLLVMALFTPHADQPASPRSVHLEKRALLGGSAFRGYAPIQALCVTRDLVAVVDTGGHVLVWRRASRRLVTQATIGPGDVSSFLFCDNQCHLIVGADTGLWELRLDKGKAQKLSALPVRDVQADGRHVVAWTPAGILLSIELGRAGARVLRTPHTVSAVGFVRGQPAIVTSGGQIEAWTGDQWIRVDKLPTGDDYALLSGHAVSLAGSHAYVLDLAEGVVHRTPLPAPARVLRVKAEGVVLALRGRSGRDGLAYLKLGAPPVLRALPVVHRCLIRPVTVDVVPTLQPAELWFAVGATARRACEPATEAVGHSAPVHWVSLTRDGSRILSADAHQLLVWDRVRGKVVAHRFLERCPRLPLVSYDPQHELVAYVRGDCGIEVARVQPDGLHTLGTIPPCHGAQITAVAWLRRSPAMLAVAYHKQDAKKAVVRLFHYDATRSPVLRRIASHALGTVPVVQLAAASPESFAALDARGRIHWYRYKSGRVTCYGTEQGGRDLVAAPPWYLTAFDATAMYDARTLLCSRLTDDDNGNNATDIEIQFHRSDIAMGYRARLLAARTLRDGTVAAAAGAGTEFAVGYDNRPVTAFWSAGKPYVTAAQIAADGKLIVVGLTSGELILLEGP